MSTIIDPISSLLGVHRISGGKSIFDFAKFTQLGVILDDLTFFPAGVSSCSLIRFM